MSKIEWTGKTWNPVTGCTKISAGCKFCYAEVMHNRLQSMGLEKYMQPFTKVVTHETELLRPYTWKKPQVIFVNSMSDIFHKDVPTEFIQAVWKVMNENPQHTFQVLTKRADRIPEIDNLVKWTSNIWMGVSVEDQQVLWRVEHLSSCGALIKFLSCEPLIRSLSGLNLKNINWVIVGGESGHGKIRPMFEEWVIEIRDNCQESKVPFFFKQWGGHNKKATGRLLQGKEFNEMPKTSNGHFS